MVRGITVKGLDRVLIVDSTRVEAQIKDHEDKVSKKRSEASRTSCHPSVPLVLSDIGLGLAS